MRFAAAALGYWSGALLDDRSIRWLTLDAVMFAVSFALLIHSREVSR